MDDNAKSGDIFLPCKARIFQGITFSGGDPLHPQNRSGVAELYKRNKNAFFPKKQSGSIPAFLWEEVKDEPYIKDIDVLVDGEFVEELKDVKLFERKFKSA